MMFVKKPTSLIPKVVSVLLLIGMFHLMVHPVCAADKDARLTQETGTVLETITVTADKREENVQKVTSSITVLTDMAVEDAGIESTRDIWKYIPNMITFHAGTRDYWSAMKIRGISNTPFGDPAVALYIDDVSYAGIYAFDSPLFDIERIEVLKGPQGTLYGRSTEGGVINVVTKSPGNIFEAKVRIEAGNFNKRQVDALINTPLVKDKLFFRLAALKSSRDGYIKNLYNDGDIDNQDTISANAKLFFTPTDNLDLDLTFRVHEFDDDGGFPMVPVDKSKYQAATGLTDLDDFEVATNFGGESSSKSYTTSLRIKYELDYLDLVSITAYRNMDNEASLDGDFTPSAIALGYNSVESDAITQELRLQSKDSNESFKWLVGLYYGDDGKDYAVGYGLDTMLAAMMGVPYDTRDTHVTTLGSEDMAVFGQSTVRFFEDALGVTAGLRYERSKRTMDHKHTFGGMLVAAPLNDMDETYSELLPKVAIDCRINDNAMTYASVARGYKAGGFVYATDDPELASFDPEVSTAFELGLKTEFPEQGLRFNFAGFYTEADDYQDRVQIDAMTIMQENVTKVDIYGFELEAFCALTDSLSVNGFLGYTHAEYGDYIDPMTMVNYKDNRVAKTPEYNSGLFLEYRNKLGIFARAEIQLFGSSYFDRANSKEQSSYALYNMKIGYEQDKWDIYLATKNLTDKQYFLESYEDPTLGFMATVGDPRTISLLFNYRF